MLVFVAAYLSVWYNCDPLLTDSAGLVLNPPPCFTEDGDPIIYYSVHPQTLWENGISFAVATQNPLTKQPIILFDAKHVPQAPAEFQQFIFAHECEHHTQGHVKEYFEAAMSGRFMFDGDINEYERSSDCRALKRLREYAGFGDEEFTVVFNTMVDYEFLRRATKGVVENERVQRLHSWTPEERRQHAIACLTDKYTDG